ncbi:MAG: GDP-mannose 4,6-dehydratase [Firmicutes bacterium]|nr:GDP-mannose 4,6-dehydratase [Bacillota bacterium]
MTKRALITGITGQDGPYLAKLLLSKGYQVFGTVRGFGTPNTERLSEVGIIEEVELVPLELLNLDGITEALETIQPHEVYNLAAQSSVAASFKQPLITGDHTGLGAARLLEGIRTVNPRIKFYQASTSEMFGKVRVIPQNEETSFNPRSPYAIAKLYAHFMTVTYREAYDIFCCAGILFNHESPLRGLDYVTRKITHTVARIKSGLERELRLGSLDVQRDWGFAPEYVEAMWLMIQQEQPEDFVIATGEPHSVREFVQKAFSHVGLDWQDYVVTDPAFYRPAEVNMIVGDPAKAGSKLNWRPKTTFNELVGIMVDADMERVAQKS